MKLSEIHIQRADRRQTVVAECKFADAVARDCRTSNEP